MSWRVLIADDSAIVRAMVALALAGAALLFSGCAWCTSRSIGRAIGGAVDAARRLADAVGVGRRLASLVGTFQLAAPQPPARA